MLGQKFSRFLELLLAEVLAPFYAVFPQFMRNGLSFFAQRFYEGTRNAQYYWSVLTRLRIGNTVFKLWVKGGHKTAQEIYLKMEKTQEIYEPLMVECVHRCWIFQSVPYLWISAHLWGIMPVMFPVI